MHNAIEKEMTLNAPVARVWRAVSDSREFGTWFGVAIDQPFAAGAPAYGKFANPKYAHLTLEITVEAIEPERYFAFWWHPYAIDPSVDYSQEPKTLVEFTLTPADGGTHLSIKESGFANIPEGRRPEAFRMNERGWEAQIQNIARHVGHTA